ncbi:MAG TPA: restriction endonuclease subunit S [Patescibacteria group bacterium]|nr:restriction endonuclease subunit S [Patescibacteria group bacterium]
MLELSQNWAISKLINISIVVLGQSPPSSTYNEKKIGLPFFQGKAEFGVIYPIPRIWCSKPKKIAEKGDVLISIRAPVGPTNICLDKSCIGRGLAAIRGLSGIESFFILYLIRAFESIIAEKGTGSTFNAISGDQLKNIEIPLPPLNEQHRIVEKIEELFTKLDAGVVALEKVRAQLKRYRQAVLKAAFSGQLTAEWRQKHSNVGVGSSRPLEASQISDSDKSATTLQNDNLPDLPTGWEWKNGKSIFDFITSGSRGWAKYYSDTGPIFLRMGNLDHNSISLDLRNIQHVQLPKGIEGIRTKVEANDILISITADVGMIALIPENFDEAYINQHIALCRPNKEAFQKYVAWYLVCQEGGLKQFQNMRRGATKIGLGLDDIRLMKIPITIKDEQQQIVFEIERRFSVAEEVGKTVYNALKQAKRLRQSILKRAFEGKLVPQDPNDEPAEILIARIKEEKQKMDKKKKR